MLANLDDDSEGMIEMRSLPSSLAVELLPPQVHGSGFTAAARAQVGLARPRIDDHCDE